jgi:pyrroline-5-carboxylate reductase
MKIDRIAILGAGDIGVSIGHGILDAGLAAEVIITRHNSTFSEEEKGKFTCLYDNAEAVRRAFVLIMAPKPQQADKLLAQIKDSLTEDHLLISVVSGLGIEKMEELVGKKVPIVRAMLNTAIRVRQSMTFLAFSEAGQEYRSFVQEIFDSVGLVLYIEDRMFPQATVLGGSGVALAMKFLRGYMQACIQHGFDKHDAVKIATQVLKGASMLIEAGSNHPEVEIDKVTTPEGCTIDAVNEMDHRGFTSSLLKAIKVGIKKARKLYS